MVGEMAMFVDFENLRYGMLNNHGEEPDIDSLVAKAKKYGRPTIMRAYADFSEHPNDLSRKLQIAGIEAINVPVKRTTYKGSSGMVERVKNAADMVLALDAMIEALEADNKRESKSFLLVTGDRDYVKLVTLLRNRFGQKVIIAGVPGTVSGDLVRAADESDPIDVPIRTPTDMPEIKRKIIVMVRRGPAPLDYWSIKVIDQWAQDIRQGIPGTSKERRDAIGQLIDDKVLVRQEIDHPKRGKITKTIVDESQAKALGF